MFERFKHVLRSPEGDGTGAGGAGDGGDPLFGDAGAGGAGDAGKGGAAGAGDAGKGGAGDAGKPPGVPSWKEALPEDLRKLPFMEKYQSVEQLAKGYANIEKMIGADKIVVPQKGTALADMRDVFEKIGLPKTLEEYKLEGLDPAKVDPTFAEAYKKEAHALGVLPEQAKGLVDWFTKVDQEAQEQTKTLHAKAQKADLDAYKAATGEAYSLEIARAKAALKTLDKADQEFLQKSGLSKNTTVLKMLAKYGATLGEGSLKGEGVENNGQLSPAQAQEKIKEVMNSGLKHPYFDSKHADHVKAKKEMTQWYKYAHPDKKPATQEI
jgi:hypothetical protein